VGFILFIEFPTYFHQIINQRARFCVALSWKIAIILSPS